MAYGVDIERMDIWIQGGIYGIMDTASCHEPVSKES